MSEGVVQLFLRCNFPFMFWYWCFWSKYWCSSVPFLWIGKVFDTVQISIPSNIRCLIQKEDSPFNYISSFLSFSPSPFLTLFFSFIRNFNIQYNTSNSLSEHITHTKIAILSNLINSNSTGEMYNCVYVLYFGFSFHFFSFLFFFHKSNK